MKFIDLFAGLGGFHLALKKLGHTCVFASEIDETLRSLYEQNYGMSVAGDIREVPPKKIPSHDILCAGFPCQPFSKARKRNSNSGSDLVELYQEIIRVIEHHKPQYLIMENVPDLIKHEGGGTWENIKKQLEELDYDIEYDIVSPHEFGIPQIRKRMYIVGSRTSLNRLEWPEPSPASLSVKNVLDSNPDDAVPISKSIKRCLEIWQDFLDRIPRDERIPLPLWSMEFGATYPYRHSTPYSVATRGLRNFRGSHGQLLSECTSREEILSLLPSHARTSQNVFPRWKINFIEKNRRFYRRHKDWLDVWMKDIIEFPSSFQKFEWNCHEHDPCDEDRTISKYMIQTRPSGVRIKRTTTAPSLVAMTATQVPIIGWEERYMTVRECKRLQSIREEIRLPEKPTRAYSALGNAVNVEVARQVAEHLLRTDAYDVA